jgi:GntR family transcriptional regulator
VDVDRRADRPLYLQLADVLRAQIHNGQYPPGDRLPSESALIAAHDVSRGTVRDAIGVLRSEGLVVVEHGRGAYVRNEAALLYIRHLGGYPDLPLAQAFTADVAAQGRQASVRQIDAELIDGIHVPLAVPAHGLLCFADGRPVQTAIVWNTLVEHTAGEQIRTRRPTRGERRLLQLDDGIPVVQIHRSSIDNNERSIAVLPSDRTELRTARHD